ncbi:MAG: hypothetical protein KKH98_12535 [Spirochaetes bacterium]|nr:hypothetical protein [Spirochaetota bacterium]
MKIRTVIIIIIGLLFLLGCGGKKEDEKMDESKLVYKPVEDTREEAAPPEKTEYGYNFSIKAPKANYVSIVGDFNNWLDNRTPMVKNKYGVWSITIPLKRGIYSYKFNIDNTWVIDANNPNLARDSLDDRRSIIEVTEDSEGYEEPIYRGVTNARSPVMEKTNIIFSYKDKFAETVSIAGTFNNWEKDQYFLKKNKHGVWETAIHISKGEYYYKFNVDGVWKHDPNNPVYVDDKQGDYKSVLVIDNIIKDRADSPTVINKDIIRFSFYNKDLPSNYTISVIGDFNDWKTNKDVMADNDFNKTWFTTVELKKGEYYYKFYLAGTEFFDPQNTLKKVTPEGITANYLKVILPAGKRNVKFSYRNRKAKDVFLVGDFNNWNPQIDKLQKDQTGLWYIVKKMYPGTYSYQYIVDEKWITDPSNGDSVTDQNGGFSSFLRVQ